MKQRIFKKTMLEYCKIILEKMSFSGKLFRKEYRKTFQYLDEAEHDELKKFLRQITLQRLPFDNRPKIDFENKIFNQ